MTPRSSTAQFRCTPPRTPGGSPPPTPWGTTLLELARWAVLYLSGPARCAVEPQPPVRAARISIIVRN